MKKYILLIAILCLIVAALCCSCNAYTEEEGLFIITTIYAPYDFVREITAGVDGVSIKMLLPPGSESHTYEPTPQDIIALERCDLFIYTGGENDQWVTNILSSLGNKDMEKIVMSEVVNIEEHEAHHHEEQHSHEDPHIWTSLRNAQLIVSAVAQKLAAIDAINAESFIFNAGQYNSKLAALDIQFQEMTDNAIRNTIIVADRFPLKYFVEDYALSYYAAYEGCAAETEASSSTIALLSDKVKELNVPVVFIIELSNGNLARTVTEGTDAKILTFYTCHNVSASDFQRGYSYYEMMVANFISLTEALN